MTPGAPEESDGPYDPDAQMRPDLMVVEPSVVDPGETVKVLFPRETERGIAYVLEAETAEGWSLRYFLSAGESQADTPGWWPADDPGRYEWPDIGVAGPGPNFLMIPDVAEAGDYRICTANAAVNFCAPVTIEKPGQTGTWLDQDPPRDDQPSCESTSRPVDVDEPEGWTALPAPPLIRARAEPLWAGDQLLLIGGDSFYGGTTHSDVQAFDPVSETWRCVAPLPFPAARVRAVWTGEVVYAWANGRALEYEPTVDRWRELPQSLVTPDVPVAFVWAGDRLVVWGQWHPRLSRAGAVYDPASETWRQTAEAPIDMNEGEAVWTGEQMVVIGAHLDRNRWSATDNAVGVAYSPATDTWEHLPELHLNPNAHDVVYSQDEVIGVDYDTRVGAYNLQSRQWQILEPMPLPETAGPPRLVRLADGRIFVWFSGAAIFDPSDRGWTVIDVPHSVAGSGPVHANQAIYFAGGSHEGHRNGLWRYEPTP